MLAKMRELVQSGGMAPRVGQLGFFMAMTLSMGSEATRLIITTGDDGTEGSHGGEDGDVGEAGGLQMVGERGGSGLRTGLSAGDDGAGERGGEGSKSKIGAGASGVGVTASGCCAG